MKSNDSFSSRQMEAIRAIRNWIAHFGKAPSIRELMGVLKYKSPRSVQDLLSQLGERGIIKKNSNGSFQLLANPDFGPHHAQTVDVPVVGTVAAGMPILAEENVEGYLPVSTSLAKSGAKYFLLHVKGDSMNESGINDGDLVLVRQQPAADNGQKVVALVDDEATVKEYHQERGVVVLKPRSTNGQYKPIVLTEDFQIQGIVVATIPKLV